MLQGNRIHNDLLKSNFLEGYLEKSNSIVNDLKDQDFSVTTSPGFFIIESDSLVS